MKITRDGLKYLGFKKYARECYQRRCGHVLIDVYADHESDHNKWVWSLIQENDVIDIPARRTMDGVRQLIKAIS